MNKSNILEKILQTSWQEVKLGDICEVTTGKRPPYKQDMETSEYTIPVYGGNGIAWYTKEILIDYPVILTGRVGTIGTIYKVEKPCWVSDNALILKPIDVDFDYIYYTLNLIDFTILNRGSTQPLITQTDVKNLTITIPPLEVQKKIAGVLSALDDKIELNNKINQNLELQAQALFKSWFVDKTNPNRKTIKAEEFFNITIGKTPPRKEPEWFSKNTNDIKWISISDMGNCGLYISDSSEYLVPDSISKFNVKIVPDNTVLLSFKLTVGRIAITDGEMATNEAIAHFGTDKKEINEYLYYYLKNFNFQTMGSTSSIATAVNSKIIKSMPFVMPEKSELKDFHSVISPMFAQIKANQRENIQLSALRDTLLPKLMSGEIDVSKVIISADKLSFTED